MYSRSINYDSKSVFDDSRETLLIVASLVTNDHHSKESLMIVIYNHNMLIAKAFTISS
jgi:hypothetical protein